MCPSRSNLPDLATVSGVDPNDLLARARRLDRNALELLHQTHYPEVYRYICFRLPDEPTCTEIAAQVFVHFLEALRKRHAPQNNLPGWLLRDAGRLVDEHFRKTRKRGRASTTALPDEAAAAEDRRSRFYAALLRLPVQQQHFLALRFSQPRTLGEVARLMNRSEEKLRYFQQRVMESLHAHLGDQL